MIKQLGFKTKEAQKLISRKRVYKNNQTSYYNIGSIIEEDNIYVALFAGITRGLSPLYEEKDFAIFDKPANLLSHPNSRLTPYSLLDEVKHHFGEFANIVNRLDFQTSGLVLISKNKVSERELKMMFENKEYKKIYFAIVKGKIQKEKIIDKPIALENGNIGIKMSEQENGKKSVTKIKPIQYDKHKDLTLLEIEPLTGRQHQIRVHLNSISHPILGDPLYGVDEEFSSKYLDKNINEKELETATGCKRLCLHSHSLSFSYQDKIFKFSSKYKNSMEFFYETIL